MGQAVSVECQVLGKKLLKNNQLQLSLFSLELGRITAFQKISTKLKNAKPVADLFDRALIQAQPASTSETNTLFFIKEYQLLRRRSAISQSYDGLCCASGFASMLFQNLEHAHDAHAIYVLADQAFNSWEGPYDPELILLKAVYKLSKLEGYPVREQWYRQLSVEKQQQAKVLINSPLDQLSENKEATASLMQSLTKWLSQETDLAAGSL